MRKLRKVMALLLTLAMVMGMSLTAFAEKTGASIVVSGLATPNQQNVTIYEIYRLDENDNGWVKAEWVPENVTPDTLKDPTILEALETAALDSGVGVTESSSTGSVTFNNLQAGAYLVLATDTKNEVEYSPMVAITYKYDENSKLIIPTTAPVVAKAESYTTDKSQADEDAVVEVGDLITYQITTTVPYNDGTVEEFTVTDTLNGATYYLSGAPVKEVEPISKITVNGVEILGISIPDNANGETTFTVNLSQLLAGNQYAGQRVIIQYTAKVNSVDTITNTANSSHDATPDIETTYTGQMQITKWNEDKSKALSGAEFAIYKVVESTKYYAGIDGNGYITGVWYPEENGEVPTSAGKVTTGEDGTAVVKGLDVGTHYFKEVKAPDGYSVNSQDVECSVTKTEKEGKVSVYGETEMTDTKLAELPGTGGIGTTIFTIGGCVIMIAAAGLYFASRRKHGEN